MTAASAAACVAGGVADGHLVVVAKGSRREQGQAEEFIAHVFGKFFARRNGAETVGGHKNFHLSKHLEHNGYTNRQAEAVVAQISAGHTNGADHALQTVGNDRFVGNGKKDIL